MRRHRFCAVCIYVDWSATILKLPTLSKIDRPTAKKNIAGLDILPR